MKMPGPYVPLDVNYARDRAIASAGEAAELLYVRGLAYCKHTYSDGFIPDYDIDEVAKRLRNVPQRIAALVREGLWIAVDGGWLIRNWSRWNESTDEVKAKRERDAERQRKRRGQTKDDLGTNDPVTADVQCDNAVTPDEVTPPKARQGKAETEQRQDTAVVLADAADPTSDLVTEHFSHYEQKPPPSAVTEVRREVMRMVAEHVEPDRIRAGLARVREKRLSVRLLPQLVTEVTPIRKPSTTDQRVAGTLALAQQYEERGE